MKKYFPTLLFVMVFSGFLGIQVAVDFLSARPTTKEKNILTHYENLFTKISFKSVEGKEVKLSEVKSPIVILNFWASWCRPCLVEFPSLVKLVDNFSSDEVQVFGINTDDEDQQKKIEKIVSKYNLNFSQYADKDGKLLNEFRVSALPMTIIFNQGKVLEISRGTKNFYSDEIVNKFKKIVKDSKKKNYKVVLNN